MTEAVVDRSAEKRAYMRAYYISHGAIGREPASTRGAARHQKQCKRCGITKTREGFVVRKSGPRAGQFGSYCLQCTNELRAERVYSVSQTDIAQMLRAQDGACAICSRRLLVGYKASGPGKMVVDHDHRSGRVRGLLCVGCNTAIGVLQDDPDVIDRAARYIRENLTEQRHE